MTFSEKCAQSSEFSPVTTITVFINELIVVINRVASKFCDTSFAKHMARLHFLVIPGKLSAPPAGESINTQHEAFSCPSAYCRGCVANVAVDPLSAWVSVYSTRVHTLFPVIQRMSHSPSCLGSVALICPIQIMLSHCLSVGGAATCSSSRRGHVRRGRHGFRMFSTLGRLMTSSQDSFQQICEEDIFLSGLG